MLMVSEGTESMADLVPQVLLDKRETVVLLETPVPLEMLDLLDPLELLELLDEVDRKEKEAPPDLLVPKEPLVPLEMTDS